MNGHRPGRYIGSSEGRIYYPSGNARSGRGSRFHRHCQGSDVRGEKPSLLKRFRPRADRQNSAKGSGKSEKRFRPHSTSARTAAKSVPAGKASAAPRAVPHTELPPPPQYYEPAYPYYPAPPVYPVYPPPPPPPAYPYAVYDPYGRRLSEEDIKRLDALEALEDRYGRDFDRYSGGTATSPVSKEIFPKNYLVETDEQ